VDLNTRLLRSFLVLAEELHFTRAAARLYVTQQALSGHIRQLETTLGVPLVERSTRHVQLTSAGERLVPVAGEVIARLDETFDELHAHYGDATRTLTLGFFAFAALELTTPILKRFNEQHPDVRVVLREFNYNDVTCGLASGATDVAFLRPPISMPGLRSETLFVEARVVALPLEHPLAGRASVRIAEVLDLPIFAPDTEDGLWRSFWLLDAHRGGRPAPLAIDRTASVVEELEAVANGQGVMITSGALRRYMSHPNVRYVLLEDDAGAEVSVAHRQDRSSDLVEAFVACALQTRRDEPELVAILEAR